MSSGTDFAGSCNDIPIFKTWLPPRFLLFASRSTVRPLVSAAFAVVGVVLSAFASLATPAGAFGGFMSLASEHLRSSSYLAVAALAATCAGVGGGGFSTVILATTSAMSTSGMILMISFFAP